MEEMEAIMMDVGEWEIIVHQSFELYPMSAEKRRRYIRARMEAL